MKKSSSFMGWFLVALGAAVFFGMLIDLGNFSKWWLAIDIFVAMFWIGSGIAFLRLPA